MKQRNTPTLAFAMLVLGLFASASELTSQDRISVGKEAPGFSLESSTGETFDLASQRGDKNVLLVFFRGTW